MAGPGSRKGIELYHGLGRETEAEQYLRRAIATGLEAGTETGVLIIHARRFRTQEKNRQDAMARLIHLIRQAAQPPKPRRGTRPTRASRERRIDLKRRRSQIKKSRRPISDAES